MAPKVSVIIPVYNTEKYLKECLESVIKQTLKDIEIICVDDGSTDNSLKILEEYANSDSRIKILKQKNLYAGVARNNALKHATGEYVFFVDSDDVIHMNTLSLTYNLAKKYNQPIVQIGVGCFKKDINEINRFNNKATQVVDLEKEDNIYFKHSAVFWDKLYKREFIKKYDLQFEQTRNAEDLIFSFTAISLAKNIITTQDIMYFYRLTENSTNMTRNWSDEFVGFKKTQELLKQFKLYDKFEKSFKNRLCFDIIEHIDYINNFSDKNKAFKYIKSNDFAEFDLNTYAAENFYDKSNYDDLQTILKSHSIWQYLLYKFFKKLTVLKICRG